MMNRLVTGGLLLASVLLHAGLCAAAPAPAANDVGPTTTAVTASSNSSGLINGFVQRSGTRFVVQSADGDADSCQTFYFAGANSQFLMVFAADPAKRQFVTEILDGAKDIGLSVLRIWTFADGPTTFNALQRYPGQYDEGTLTGLDFVMDEASKRGIRLTLVFINYWSQYGGVDQYNVWSFQAGTGTCNGDTVCRDNFFSDPMAAQYYRDHVKAVLTRVNSINGRLYREDPTIFSYDLMNEPRSQQDLYLVNRVTTDSLQQAYNLSYNQGNDLQQWVENMAGYVKSIDPIHLLTIGSEGFAGNYTPMYLYANPGAWGSLLGVDFVRNHQTAGIDYSTMHVYVDQWLCTAEGATEEGQLAFMTEWLDAHQQAAEEDLMMPVVLEEFGSKLDARAGQYKLGYDNCLDSAKRGGSCAGVMFWDITHEGYSLVDPWMDGQLRFGGGYSNWVNTTDPDRLAIIDLVKGYSGSVAAINTKSAGTDTCVWYAPPKMGQGCKNLDVKLELGGLPWTCLDGEPTGLNWCNAADAASVYKDPPQAWLSTTGRDLPYNTIEGLILGNLTNNGSTPINLKNSWIIVPYSMGVQTQFEGVWERIEDPNDYFTVYCWYVNGNGQDLCSGGVDVSFTNFTWPMGTKYDRGVNISFTADLTLGPGSSISSEGGSTQVMLSFKDATHAFRLDVSDLGIDGASNCPQDVLYATYPPPNPPAPKPCTAGPDPNRGCPALEWYFNSPMAVAPAASVATSSISTAGRRLQQNTGGSSSSTSGLVLANPPESIVDPGPVPGNPTNITQQAIQDVFSVSAPVSGASIGFVPGVQYIITAKIASMGQPRVTEVISPVAGDTATNAADTPHTDALGDGSNVLGTTVYLVMSFLPAGYSKIVYRVLAGGAVPTDSASGAYFKGVYELDWPTNVTNIQFFAESPLTGLKVTLTDVALTNPADLGTNPNKLALPAANLSDVYSPCMLPQNSGNDAVYVVSLPAGQSDTLNAVLCSPGGYYQALRAYNAGKEIARTDPAGVPNTYALNAMAIKGGSDYIFTIAGSLGDPYGSYRGHPGIRFTWQSGRAFNGEYDGAPVNISAFVRVDQGNLMQGCDREAYVGCNTWDLMDKSRYESERPEVQSRMDAMVQAGWRVGRTWGFSLGDGTGQSALGETVLDPSATLEPAPGVYNEEVWESLDFVLAEAAKRNLRLIIPIEDYWLSIDRYVNWSATAVTKNDFYTDWTIRQLYKDHLKAYVNRVNTVNNRTYATDPTIYAWDLLNEPRCTGCGYALQAWVEEMAVYMKAIDPNHMVGLGAEGFYSTTCDRVYLNPGAGSRRTGIASSPWAAQEGQDFLANNVVPDIDFATTHIWMDNWLGYGDYSTCILCDLNFDYSHGGNIWEEKLDYTVSWLTAHIQDAGQLGKPLVTEEFGKAISAAKVYTGELPKSPQKGETVAMNDSLRDIFFTTIYGLISESAQNNGPAQGSNFWNLYTVGIADDDPYKITLADNSTMAIVAAHQANMSAVAARPGTCPTQLAASTPTVYQTAQGPAAGSASQTTETRGTAVPPSMP